MYRTLVLVPFLTTACIDALDSTNDQAATGDNGMHGAAEHIMLDASHKGGGGPSLLTYHDGPVLHATKMMAIFWGSSWNDPTAAGDKISGLDTFFGGWSNSQIANASTEYYDTSGNVSASSTYLGHTIDSTTPPRHALNTSGAVAEACMVTNNNPDPNGVYFIYTENGPAHASYCAWHSWGSCSNGAAIQVAYMPNIDGIAGCDPQDTQGVHSEGLAALANVTSHELSEAITDPRGSGWYDAGGAENGDKCAWTFGSLESVGGEKWKLQQEWSNDAFNAGTGSPVGCIP